MSSAINFEGALALARESLGKGDEILDVSHLGIKPPSSHRLLLDGVGVTTKVSFRLFFAAPRSGRIGQDNFSFATGALPKRGKALLNAEVTLFNGTEVVMPRNKATNLVNAAAKYYENSALTYPRLPLQSWRDFASASTYTFTAASETLTEDFLVATVEQMDHVTKDGFDAALALLERRAREAGITLSLENGAMLARLTLSGTKLRVLEQLASMHPKTSVAVVANSISQTGLAVVNQLVLRERVNAQEQSNALNACLLGYAVAAWDGRESP